MNLINNEGQTCEGGHRWYLDDEGDVNCFYYDVQGHNGPGCRDCAEVFCEFCNRECYQQICPVASIQPYLPLEFE